MTSPSAVPSTSPLSFDEFVDARYQRLVATAYLLTRDTHLAEDLVQTALAKSWPAWRDATVNGRTVSIPGVQIAVGVYAG